MPIEVVDPAAVSDEELEAAVERLVAVAAGIAPFCFSCKCGRYYKLHASSELNELVAKIRRALTQRTGKDPIQADTSRFSLLEIDD